MLELAQKLIILTGSQSKPVYRETPNDDPRKRQPDISAAKELADWEPDVKLEEGIKGTTKYFEGAM